MSSPTPSTTLQTLTTIAITTLITATLTAFYISHTTPPPSTSTSTSPAKNKIKLAQHVKPPRPESPTTQHISTFLSLDCSPELLALKVWPDAKELTESFGCFYALKKYIDTTLPVPVPDVDVDASDDSMYENAIVVVGDGSTPRTAVLLAFLLKGWIVYSVDPQLSYSYGGVHDSSSSSLTSPPSSNNKHEHEYKYHKYDNICATYKDVTNLLLFSGKIEDIKIKARRSIYILMHAHVSNTQALSSLSSAHLMKGGMRGFVCCPCCNYKGKQGLVQGKDPDVVYEDWGIWSEKREMCVWKGRDDDDDDNKDEMYDVKDEGYDESEKEEIMEAAMAMTMTIKSTSTSTPDNPVTVIKNKDYIQKLANVALNWHNVCGAGAEAVDVAMERALLFYSLCPTFYGCKEVFDRGNVHVGSCLEELKNGNDVGDCGGEERKLLCFRGRYDSNTRIRKLSSNLVFANLLLVTSSQSSTNTNDDPISAFHNTPQPFSQKPTDSKDCDNDKDKHDKYNTMPGKYPTDPSRTLQIKLCKPTFTSKDDMTSLCHLLTYSSLLTVVGYPLFNVKNGSYSLEVVGVKVHVVRPEVEVVRERLRVRDEGFGVVRKGGAGWYTRTGEMIE